MRTGIFIFLQATLVSMVLPAALYAGQQPDVHARMDAATSGPVDQVIGYHARTSASRSRAIKPAPDQGRNVPPPYFKHYPNLPHISLAREDSGGPGLSAAMRAPQLRANTQTLRLAELGQLLYLAAGVTANRDGVVYRAAPSAGALFPSELYLLVRKNQGVQGLSAGLYHYDAQYHRLAFLNSATLITAAALFGAGQTEASDVLAVVTSVLGRTAYKYHDRAYRLALADAGHVLENLRLAGHRAGLQATLLRQFDDALTARMLGVDNVDEVVLAVMDLRRATASTASEPRRLQSKKITPDSIALPAPATALQSVYHSITHRRSKRHFSPEPVPLTTLSSMLADMAQAPQLSSAIQIHLVVNRVAGLQPGIYRYLPQHPLQTVRPGEFAAAAQSAALSQNVIGHAAVVLVLSGERERILAPGPRGYRHAYLEAGMLGERWLLSAVARGLAACPVGAFYDDEAAALIGADAQHHWVLHFAALGLPAE